jgi:hypothetical protein
MSRALILLPLLAGCRLGFDEHAIGVLDARIDATGDATGDATPDAAVMQIVIGERAGGAQNTFDTSIAQGQPGLANGTLEDMSLTSSVAGLDTALLRFDMGSIPAGATVVAARIDLVRITYGDDTPGEIAVYPMLEPWDEASATWNQRSAATPWTVTGGSRGAEIMRLTPNMTFSFTLPAALVQSWIDTPATNFGVAINGVDINNDTHYHLATREAPGGAERPQLVVDVTP